MGFAFAYLYEFARRVTNDLDIIEHSKAKS